MRHKNKEQVAVGDSLVERDLLAPFGDIADTSRLYRQ
jgi:hypothetical protein